VNTEDILQTCLEEIAAGRQTPAQCAAQYPHVPGLLAELNAAQALMAWTPPALSPAIAQRHQAQLRAALAANSHRAPARRPSFALPRWALAAMLVLALVLGGAGTVSVAAASVPGQALYPVKRAVEAVQGSLTPAARQAAWHAGLAAERTAELKAVAGQSDAAQVEALTSEIATETQAALANVAQAPHSQQAALLTRILGQIQAEQAVLAELQSTLPAPSQAGLEQALAVSQQQRATALERLREVLDDQGAPPATATTTATTTATHTTQATATSAAATGTHAPQATATIAAIRVPPGQAKKTATATPAAASNTPTASGNSGGAPNCRANSPNSPNYCTPTPGAGGVVSATATPPGNSGGQPNCNANSPNSPNYCTPTRDKRSCQRHAHPTRQLGCAAQLPCQ
jgi:hypothetical protein